MTEDQLPNAPYGVICSIHGKQGLSKENYELQMSLPDSLWKCPIEDCPNNSLLNKAQAFNAVGWDDERYEASEGIDDVFDFDDEPEETKADLDYHERKENGEL